MSSLRARLLAWLLGGVVVVGAGAIGLAVALQLRRAGVDGVVVVDRNPSAGMGSTSRANGGVRAQFTTSVNIAFSQFTIEQLRALHDQTGGQVGFRGVGYLFLTGTDSGEIALRRAWELQRSLGVDVQWLSATGTGSPCMRTPPSMPVRADGIAVTIGAA